MKLEYDLENSPPLTANLVLGLQWALIAISTIVILGKIVGSIHLGQAQDEILYLQTLSHNRHTYHYFPAILV